MSNLKRFIPIALSIMMIFSIFAPALAEPSSSKEEVIYILMDASGFINDIYVVNIFDSKNIVDYGNYSEIKMLTTNDKIMQENDIITFSTDADKVYYQGTLSEAESPWDISLRYFVDDEEYSASEVAGQSGRLKIQFKITKNVKCKKDFFEDYALQASFSFDTDICNNIEAKDATIVNVGQAKQLTYTILPGNGLETYIIADVVDFEMDSVSINGIKLNLKIEVDNQELLYKINELSDGIAKVDDGVASINKGAQDLKIGSRIVNVGTSDLNEGVIALDDGIIRLQDGIITIQNGLNILDSKSYSLVAGSSDIKTSLLSIQSSLYAISSSTENLAELMKAFGEIKAGINDFYNAINELRGQLGYTQYKELMLQSGLNIDSLVLGNTMMVSEISVQIANLQEMLSSLENVFGYELEIAKLKLQIDQLQNIAALIEGNNTAIRGIESYLYNLSKAVDKLYIGINNLKDRYEEFDMAITRIASVLSFMLPYLTELSSGINELVESYIMFDRGILEYTQGVASLIVGYDQILTGISDVTVGSKKLRTSSNELYDGTLDLYEGIALLYDNTVDLMNGTKEMRMKTADFDKQIEDQIDELLTSLKGQSGKIKSFVSEKNINVSSVQFVIKTNSIELPKQAMRNNTVKKQLTFWQKLLRLFGLY